jgi:hypothetical protein
MTTTETTTTAVRDGLGVEFRIGDRVIVNAWGGNVRLIDTGKRAAVTGITARRNLLIDSDDAHDPIARGGSVRPGYLGVLRRDGEPGFEGNRR